MATALELIVAAHGTSTKNNPGKIAASEGELLRVLNDSLNGCYAIAAHVNYLVFAVQETIAHGSLGWPYPECAEAVFRIEFPDSGNEVALVPYDQRNAETGMPAVYFLGLHYIGAGNDGDPVAESLRFFYSKMPTSYTSLDSTTDASWRSRHNPLLIADVGMYLARKDGRADDLAALAADRQTALAKFVAFLEHANVHERRMYATHRQLPSYTLESLTAMLAGGPNP